MRKSGIFTSALMAALAMSGGWMAQAASAVSSSVTAPKTKTASSTVSPSLSEYGYSRGPGWSAAYVKRMAQKRRNQQRHRRACRG